MNEQLDFYDYWNPTDAIKEYKKDTYEQFIIDTMTLNYYQQQAERLIVTSGEERLIENTLGLVGEAGEVAEKVKKQIRDSSRFSKEEITKEIGDVLFYIAALCSYYDVDLAEVANKNLEKLLDRKARGVIKGNGDNR